MYLILSQNYKFRVKKKIPFYSLKSSFYLPLASFCKQIFAKHLSKNTKRSQPVINCLQLLNSVKLLNFFFHFTCFYVYVCWIVFYCIMSVWVVVARKKFKTLPHHKKRTKCTAGKVFLLSLFQKMKHFMFSYFEFFYYLFLINS